MNVCVCVLQNGDSMSHWQASGQAASYALHYRCDDWNQLRGGSGFPWPTHSLTHTLHTLTHLLPLLPASLLSPIPVEQWRDEPSLSLVLTRQERRRREGGRKRSRRKGGTLFVFLAEGDSGALVSSYSGNLDLTQSLPHTLKITTAMSRQKSS